MTSSADLEHVLQGAVSGLTRLAEELDQASDIADAIRVMRDVQSLIRDTAACLFPERSARARLRRYLRDNVGSPVSTGELEVVGAISEYARRIRELRVEEGFQIYNGETVKAMIEDGELTQSILGVPSDTIGVTDYILMHSEPDSATAERWGIANQCRALPMGVGVRLLEYFRRNVGRVVTGEELAYVAKGRPNWPRRVRELRTEQGWEIRTRNTGRPDLPVGAYVLESDVQAPEHDRAIPDSTRLAALKRDGFVCRKCGWSRAYSSPDHPATLIELHHARWHVQGGTNELDNLVSLCNVCHDVVHRERIRWDELWPWLSKTAQ